MTRNVMIRLRNKYACLSLTIDLALLNAAGMPRRVTEQKQIQNAGLKADIHAWQLVLWHC